MNSSAKFKWLLPIVCLLLLSVAWKIWIAVPINQQAANSALVDFFKSKDFAVSEQMVDGISIIKAKAKSCHVEAARLAFEASNRDEVRYLFKAMDRFFVVVDGRVYMQQPVLSTTIDEIWSVSLRKLGLLGHVPSVIAVGASETCQAEHLPWHELR